MRTGLLFPVRNQYKKDGHDSFIIERLGTAFADYFLVNPGCQSLPDMERIFKDTAIIDRCEFLHDKLYRSWEQSLSQSSTGTILS